MMEGKRFLTIRQVAKEGILSEHHLRMLEAQKKLPGVYSGRKKLVNVPMLLKQLDEESKGETACRI